MTRPRLKLVGKEESERREPSIEAQLRASLKRLSDLEDRTAAEHRRIDALRRRLADKRGVKFLRLETVRAELMRG